MSETELDVVTEADMVFGTGGGRELRVDVHRPAEQAHAATGILVVHGGGWQEGTRERSARLGIPLARRGYVSVCNEYRLSGEAIWPACLHDTKAALRWMRANAGDLGIDPDRIAVLGMSAGAHLALMMAATPGIGKFEGEGGNPVERTDVSAALALYAPTDLARILGPGAVGALIGSPDDMETAREASPVNYVTPDFPPVFLAHGTEDSVVSWRASQQMYDLLADAGAPVEMHLLAGLPHAFDRDDPAWAENMADAMDLFLGRYVSAGASLAKAAAE